MVAGQNWLAAKRDHGKEIGAAFYFDSPVFRHTFWCVRRTLRLLCPIGDAGQDIGLFETRIFPKDFRGGHARRQRNPR